MSNGVKASQALVDVIAERGRQIADEEWTFEHDDEHTDGALALAAATYAAWSAHPSGVIVQGAKVTEIFFALWPRSWNPYSWKPTDRRRNLVKAGALILAEIERLDRVVTKKPSNVGGIGCAEQAAADQ